MKDHHCRKAEIFPRRAMKRTNDPSIGYALEITHLIHASYTVIQIVPANRHTTIGEPTRALPAHNLILEKNRPLSRSFSISRPTLKTRDSARGIREGPIMTCHRQYDKQFIISLSRCGPTIHSQTQGVSPVGTTSRKLSDASALFLPPGRPGSMHNLIISRPDTIRKECWMGYDAHHPNPK